jgi:hypothetical protein
VGGRGEAVLRPGTIHGLRPGTEIARGSVAGD